MLPETNTLAAIVESSDDAIVSKSLDGIIQTWNAAAERIFGWTASEVVGKSIAIIIPPERQDEEPRILATLRGGGRVDHFETVRVTRDGRRIDVSVTISPVRDASGTIVGASKIARDITLQKRLERELQAAKEEAERANKAKDLFLSALSHELRTPLTPVLASLSFLEARGDLPLELRRELGMMRHNVETEARLVDDLLDFIRISRGKLQLKRETVDVHGSVRNAVSMLSDDIASKPLSLSLALEAKAHYVDADPGRLQQIFFNLLSNAVKFTPAHGSVTVRSANVGQRLGVEVADTGAGIPPVMLENLFEPFRSAAHGCGGLGIGLSITRSLVEMHGGTIAAISPGLAGGATVTVELPTAAIADAPGSSEGGFAGSILLVEDHLDTRKVMARLLSSFGFAVTTAETVAEALEASRGRKFDLLISDIGLPDGSGNDIMRDLRQRMNVRGIALSGYGHEDDLRRSEEAGFEAHLVKPVNFQTLRRVVAQLCK